MTNVNCQVEHLINYAVSKGCVISIWNGSEMILSRSKVTSDIMVSCVNADSMVLLIITRNSKPLARLQFGADGLLFDYSVGEFLTEWLKVWGERNEN